MVIFNHMVSKNNSWKFGKVQDFFIYSSNNEEIS